MYKNWFLNKNKSCGINLIVLWASIDILVVFYVQKGSGKSTWKPNIIFPVVPVEKFPEATECLKK